MSYPEPSCKRDLLHVRELVGEPMMKTKSMKVSRKYPLRGPRHKTAKSGSLNRFPFIWEDLQL